MTTTTTLSYTWGGVNVQVKVTAWPDECPRCHFHVHPLFLTGGHLNGYKKFHGVFRCTRHECQGLFVAVYYKQGGGPEYGLISLEPRTATKIVYSPEISQLSPTFVELVNQAETAASIGLDQIVGIALRKALEFLVKDF